MNLALDTNAYVAFARGDRGLLTAVRSCRQLVMPFICVGELRAGFRAGTMAAENEKNFQRFLGEERVEILFADEQTTHHYAGLFALLRARGTPVPANDLWIAALVIQFDLVLATRDAHFDHFDQIPRI